jgi:hypothetical protein|nr:MAG TPA: Protein of unknown function (DUF551) [Caudoviricetes sp.]
MRLVDVEPFIEAWKESGNGKKAEAKALMNSGIYSEYDKGVALDAVADLVLALAKQLENYPSIAWTNVKDKLPEMTEEVTEVDGDRECTLWYESKPVLVFDETVYDETSRMQTAVLTDDGDWLTTFDEKRLENVTHWMPLPDEPEDNE